MQTLQTEDASTLAHAAIALAFTTRDYPAALDLIEESDRLRAQLARNAERFRAGMQKLGFTLVPGRHPIIPVMLGEATLASAKAEALLAEGIYVIAFSFPVVPKGAARIRTQMSAAHTAQQIDRAVEAFGRVGRALGVIR